MYKKMESVIQQLLARSAQLYIVCNEDDANMAQYAARGCMLIQVRRRRRPHLASLLRLDEYLHTYIPT